MFKKNYFVKSIIFSFVLLSVIIFSCEKNNVYQDDLGVCIDSFALLDSENDQKKLGSDIKCDIDHENYTISLTVPSSAELRGLKFNITPCEGVSISPASGEETDFELVEKPSGESTEEASEASSEGSSSKRYKKIFTLTKGEKSQDYTVYVTKESAPKLTEFKISANESKGIKTEISAVITDDTDTATGKILLNIPYNGSIDLTGLSFTAIIPDDHVLNPVIGVISEGIESKEFTLTKTDTGSKRVYTVGVVKGPYISAFKFPVSNTGVTTEVIGTIDHIAGTISVTVPSGVTLSGLTPTIEVGENTKSEYTPSAQADFGSNIQYTVTSSNPSATDFTKVYAVTVTQNAEPTISEFKFLNSNNSSKNLVNDITGTITQNAGNNAGEIIVKVPHDATLEGLTPTITANTSALAGTQVYKGATGTTEANTSNDFTDSHTSPVQYSAVGPAGGRKVYSVKVYKEPAITEFKFESSNNSGADFPSGKTYTGTVTDNTIAVTVANTVNVANLKASIIGDNINATNPVDISFKGSNSPYSTTITVANQYLSDFTKTYTVNLTKEAAPELSSFLINANDGKGIKAGSVTIEITQPSGSNTGTIKLKFEHKVSNHNTDIVLTGLTPTITYPDGYSIDHTSGTALSESIEGKKFILTTTLGSTSEYTVTAVKGPFIKSFKFTNSSNNGKNIDSAPITGAIDHENNTITVTLPSTVKKDSDSGNVVTLTPTIELGGDGSPTVNPAKDGPQQFTSGVPVNYTVTGADGMEKTYAVTVTRTASIEAKITKFTIDSHNGDIAHLISDRGRIVVPVTSVPANTIPTIEKSDYATVSPTGDQTFTSYGESKEYTVTAEDGSTTKTYEVHIYDSTKTIASIDSLKLTDSSSTEITPDSKNIGASTRTITITVPSSTTGLDSLMLTLTDTTPSSNLSIEPTSAQDFSNEKEVKYTLKESSVVKGHYWVKVVKSS
ncbi:DUF5018 domain-containing protein [Ichthyobacterium seriolicida]|uniref:Pkd domain containing protein n=1 Tax=Ichthyobacterium seriolicida TaxID=242600 RepID=A0A1J1E9W4_9FLAO|nr:DUF5018 domain-containing protein [Ichthyobacterium seriolicida]BAV94707.1 pkd domain containing protein [Ichthyobacterium seriolicida]